MGFFSREFDAYLHVVGFHQTHLIILNTEPKFMMGMDYAFWLLNIYGIEDLFFVKLA